ncbi:MAG TPA: hypothetical protein VGM39_16130 [Kofleriaceae bacterium]|jgi:hypothetical protein
MRNQSTVLLLLAVAVGVAGVAVAGPAMRQVRYVGSHPIPASEGGGYCEIEGPHVHVYAANKLEYRVHGRDNFFVGDPVAYGYDGPKKQYKGHHPIHVNAAVGDDEDDVEWCYIDGPHYHVFAEAPSPDFKVVGDTYFYVADPPPAYVEARPAMIKINAMYTPMRYSRPVVTVEPPSGWIGVRFGAPAVDAEVVAPVVVAPGVHAEVVAPVVRAEVVAPRVEVVVPAPSIEIGVGVSAGFGVGVGPGPGRGKHHHDNGRHNGWGKRRW